ncbi:hypothetical protein N657DRAFT_716075 [Parathielavia appendiculata]|uniref:Uncharacterized protein n=1 Tax=Parathielavia appendiculata TaxID=2587402 RepID=A0AAN6TQD4_9PEZI|nr:hypothetical protein N657DRAFT_716075 [Parathielavia appendiculata]
MGFSPGPRGRGFPVYGVGIIIKLPGRLKRIPDGELGIRNQYITWQEAVFPDEILKRTVAQNGGKMNDLHIAPEQGDLNIMYDDAAISSYHIFAKAKAAGKIPTNIRFQVSLPSPIEVPVAFVRESHQSKATELYERHLKLALERIQHTVPHGELAIQWDVAITIALLESKRGRLAAAVGPKHFVEPEDMGLMVQVATKLVREVRKVHDIAWIHMPVPRDRTDEDYFAPLKKLDLPETTELFLGVLHPDGLENTQKRIASAYKASAKQFGVATECGLVRTDPREGNYLLDLTAGVSIQW